MQTVPEHEAKCPICQARYKDHCHDRDMAQDFAELRAQLAAAESERDRYLTRACVAEAKVAKVREMATEQTLVNTESSGMIPATWAHERGRSHMAQDILTAIGGKP